MHTIKKHKLLAPIIAIIFSVTSVLLSTYTSLQAATTTPGTINYQGRLLNSANNPLSGNYTFRFSLWNSADWQAADTGGGGAINVASPRYAGWQEVQNAITGTFGLFNMSLGSNTAFPNFTAGTHDFLQVEVKVTGQPDTSYEILDPQGNTADLIDRKTIHDQAYAENADTVDNRDVGVAAGDIAVLGAGGVWDLARIPSGTNADLWQIDANDNAAGGISQLSFGSALLNRILSYDPNGVAAADGWFNFSDDVNIQGNLTTTGTINGVNLAAIPFTNLAVRNKTAHLQPHFPGAVAEALGVGSHRGKIQSHFVDTDGAGAPNNFNYYQWTTKQPAIQDYDIVVRWKLPDDFTAWQATPIVFRYRTNNVNLANNRLDVSAEDSLGQNIGTLAGNSGLASATFATTNIGFGGSGIFIAGSEITIYIKMSATNAGGAYVSDLTFNYIGR